ncbi:hypothetical protein TRAPUB_4543, partial [Trametes pubescens]
GTAPFTLTLAPSYGTPRTLNISNDAFQNGKGSYSLKLPFPAKKQFLAIMSDSTGFGSGGVSPAITTGNSESKDACNLTDPGVDFYFEANSNLAQCREYTFSGYTGAIQPVTIHGVVPGGSSFVLNPPKGPTSYDWTADVASGTSLVFIMTDSQGRQGGSSQIYLVNLSDDASCLDKNSPTSVTNAPSGTSTPTKSASSTASSTASASPDSSSSGKTSAGTVVAAIVGCLVAAFIVGTLLWFYIRRQRGASVVKGGFFGRFHKREVDLMHDPSLPPPASVSPYPLYNRQGGSQHDVTTTTPNSTFDLLSAQAQPSGNPFGEGSVYTPSAATLAHRTSVATSQFPPPSPSHRRSMHSGSAAGRPDEGSSGSWDHQTITSGMRRKAAAAGMSPYAPSTRFILHTDLEDDLPPPIEDEVIELPPQYTERRALGPSPSRRSGPSASGSRSRPLSDPPPPPSPTVPTSSPAPGYLSGRDSSDYPTQPAAGSSSRPS